VTTEVFTRFSFHRPALFTLNNYKASSSFSPTKDLGLAATIPCNDQSPKVSLSSVLSSPYIVPNPAKLPRIRLQARAAQIRPFSE
jgi:hypothetical protein